MAEINQEDEGLADEVTKEVFTSYACRSNLGNLKALAHPADIAESSSLAAVPLPPTSYPLAFPPELISNGKLSALQLESVIHACTKHMEYLPNGYERAAFFIGDGAGVGKGRQIAGIILDNYIRGRVKSVWLSTSSDLYNDAQRDLIDLGSHIPVIKNLHALDKTTNTPKEGVLFVTYSTLIGKGLHGKSRFQQLVDFVGGDSFDGVLVFDEAHKAKHGSTKEGVQGTQVAAAVFELQKQLPAARVVYCSATAISEVSNMAYLSRLGLYGDGCPFSSFPEMVKTLSSKGYSFLELLAMELKGSGFYVARGLSFKSAEFQEMEVPLSNQQKCIYNEAVAMWIEIRNALTLATQLAGISSQKAWRSYWAAQQRFFKLLCVSMKVPAVVEHAKHALRDGMCVVIGLQSTGEAASDALNLKPGMECGWISVLKEILIQFVETHFPTERDYSSHYGGGGGDGNGIDTTLSVHDAMQIHKQREEEEEREMALLKCRLLEKINGLRLPPNFLDELVNELGGPNAVAEMTGRKARVIKKGPGRAVYEMRAKPDSSEMESLNNKERDAFMQGTKLVAIVSDAASTGISLHADRRVKNRRRRLHITIELAWSAEKAIQQLGRSHRSNQTSAPLYKLCFTNVGGEKRFAAAVARRLESLGALTRGDRRAASGLDLSLLNFDSLLGRKALRRMYDAVMEGSPVLPRGVTLEDIVDGVPSEEAVQYFPMHNIVDNGDGKISALAAVESNLKLHNALKSYLEIMGIGTSAGGGDITLSSIFNMSLSSTPPPTSKDLGDVKRFLNRLLGVPVEKQNLLYNYFRATLKSEIRAAKAAGVYAEGVSDLPGQNISLQGAPEVIWTDPQTGLQTFCHKVCVDRGISFESALSRLHNEARIGDASAFYTSKRPLPGSNRHAPLLAIQKAGSNNTFTILRPNTGQGFIEMDIDELNAKYHRVQNNNTKKNVDNDDNVNPSNTENTESSQYPGVKPIWDEIYENSLLMCSHGPRCIIGDECHVGKRLTIVTLLTGSVIRLWEVLEKVLRMHEYTLNKADRTMRIVRVDGVGLCDAADENEGKIPSSSDVLVHSPPHFPIHAPSPCSQKNEAVVSAKESGGALIGLRYPGRLLGEVVVALHAQQHAVLNGVIPGGAQTLNKNPKNHQQQQEKRRMLVDDVTPVDMHLFKKSFSAPKTLLNFFQPRSTKRAMDADGAAKGEEQKESIRRESIRRESIQLDVEKNKIMDVIVHDRSRKKMKKDVGESSGGKEGKKALESSMYGDQPDANDNDENDKDENVKQLCLLGFSRDQSERAIRLMQGNVEKAANWLFAL